MRARHLLLDALDDLRQVNWFSVLAALLLWAGLAAAGWGWASGDALAVGAGAVAELAAAAAAVLGWQVSHEDAV